MGISSNARCGDDGRRQLRNIGANIMVGLVYNAKRNEGNRAYASAINHHLDKFQRDETLGIDSLGRLLLGEYDKMRRDKHRK